MKFLRKGIEMTKKKIGDDCETGDLNRCSGLDGEAEQKKGAERQRPRAGGEDEDEDDGNGLFRWLPLYCFCPLFCNFKRVEVYSYIAVLVCNWSGMGADAMRRDAPEAISPGTLCWMQPRQIAAHLLLWRTIN